MPTAQGFIKTSSGTKATATFLIDDIAYTFTFNINPSVQSFQSNNAELTYSNVGQLTTTRSWSGKVGTNEVKMNITNGPSIVGPLDMPISPASTTDGSGTWTQN